MRKIDSVMILDSNDLDNFINHKILENHGVTNIRLFKKEDEALDFLAQTDIKFQFIIVADNPYSLNGFNLIDKINEQKLHEKHGEIILLSASINPSDKKKAESRKIRFLEKPLTVKNLFNNNI